MEKKLVPSPFTGVGGMDLGLDAEQMNVEAAVLQAVADNKYRPSELRLALEGQGYRGITVRKTVARLLDEGRIGVDRDLYIQKVTISSANPKPELPAWTMSVEGIRLKAEQVQEEILNFVPRPMDDPKVCCEMFNEFVEGVKQLIARVKDL